VYPYLLKEELISGLYWDTLLAGGHDDHHRELVDNHENAIIVVLSIRKVGRVIHGDKFPRLARSR